MPQAAKTTYLGEHKVTMRDRSRALLDKEHFHIFMNNYSFLDLEEKYAQNGGADGATTLYLFRDIVTQTDEDDDDSVKKTNEPIWQLAGVATKYRNAKPDVYANLGNSFHALDP